jgi:methionyl aminopeptidase
MINLGVKEVKTDSDGWTIRTVDGQASAHFEHTIAITSNGPVILSKKEAVNG